MTTNLFRQLRDMLPEATVVVGVVREIHDDDTSTVQLPGPEGLQGYAGNVFTGTLIRPRGSAVPVGQRAFVRRWGDGWVIETRAPAGPILDMPIGTIVVPPPAITWTLSATLNDGAPDNARVVTPGDAAYAALAASLVPAAGTWPYSTLPVDVFFKRAV